MAQPPTRPTTEVRVIILDLMYRVFEQLVERLGGLTDADYWGLGSRHCVADMAMHASNELVHHGAEISLLRDLHGTSVSMAGS